MQKDRRERDADINAYLYYDNTVNAQNIYFAVVALDVAQNNNILAKFYLFHKLCFSLQCFSYFVF